jgi:phosphohistidine swiveling domain-containing protein
MSIKEIIDKKMPSFTEWFEAIGYKDSEAFRQEDNSKRDRLEILYQEIGLPYDRPERMSARDIVDCTSLFQDIVNRKGNELCALRLVPIKPELPKYRQRGQTLNEYLNNWFNTLAINPDDYKVEVVPHGESKYSATFIITDKQIIGEITRGGHWQLTQGFYETPPLTFSFDFNKVFLSTSNEEIEQMIVEMLNLLLIPQNKQTIIAQKIGSEFTTEGYLKGYFEFVIREDNKKMFVDYNRLIPQMIGDLPAVNLNQANSNLTGTCASPGRAQGKVKIVNDPTNTDFAEDEILVCEMTTVYYVPLMKKAGAIVTVQGTILSHAAIVARELKKPCLVGIKDALEKLSNGMEIVVDADGGVITKI